MIRGRSPRYHIATATLGGLCAAGILGATGLLERLDYQLFDSFTRLRNRAAEPGKAASGGVSVVAVSNADVTKLNRPFPWPRDEQSVIFEKIAAAGPSVVAVDLLYPEPTTTEADSRLAFQLAACDKVAAAFYFDDSMGREAPVAPELSARSGDRMSADFGAGDWPVFRTSPALPSPTIAAGISRVGHAHSTPDADGIIRRLPIVVSDGERFYPSLALQAALLHWGVGWSQVHLDRRKLSIVDVPEHGTVEIPIDARGRMILNFVPDASTYFPATDVFPLMESRAEPPLPIADRVVYVGSLVTGHGDIYATPVNPATPGLLINAVAAEQILTQNFIRSAGGWGVALFAAVVALLTSLAFWYARPVLGGVAWVVLVFAAGYVSFLLFSRLGLWVAPAAALSSSTVAAGAMLLGYHLFVNRRHRRTVNAFSRYLGPNLGDILSENPDAFDSGPRRKILTVFFSDIVAYTTTSESLESEELIGMLNRYFDRMAEIAFSHGATVSKYMGDGMMIFFNEPLEQADHPARAVRMAIAMQDALPGLNRDFASEGLPPLSVRMGIHTGYAHVGNVGSAGFSDFTVIGSAVNLTARIMELARAGEILVSAKTRALARSEIEFDDAGDHEFRGFSSREHVYRVRGGEQSVAPAKPSTR